jgi:hypothetical protein
MSYEYTSCIFLESFDAAGRAIRLSVPVTSSTAQTEQSRQHFIITSIFHLGLRIACHSPILRTSNVAMRATATVIPASLTVLLALTLTLSTALAAPARSEELAGSNEPGGSGSRALQGSAEPNVPIVSSVPQSKTVELLLQLQDQPQAMGGQGRPASDSLRRKLTSSAASAPGQSDSTDDATPLRAALQATVLRDAAPRNAEGDSEVGGAQRDERGQQSGLSVPGSGTQTRRDPGESLLSNPVIRYIRENRELVVGVSLAVLAAIWLTANFSLRRSR